MTDNEIIKALECCANNGCQNCTFDGCTGMLLDEGVVLDLINRQKAEIEELTAKISVRDKLLDIAETKLNATEKHCQCYRSLYNEKVCLCEEQNGRDGFCKYKRRYCDGNGIYVFGDKCEEVNKKDVCKLGSIFGNYHIGLSDEQIEGLKNGKTYGLLHEEYNIFIGKAEGSESDA